MALIVASVGWWHASGTLSSVADNGPGLTWTIAVQAKHATQNVQGAIVYAQAPSGLASGVTVTATFSVAVNGRQIGISSFTGVATSSPVETFNDNAGGTAAWSSDPTTISALSMLFGTCHIDNGESGASITSPSLQAIQWGDGVNTHQSSGYRIEASGGSYTVAGAFTPTNSNFVAVAASFKDGGTGGIAADQLDAGKTADDTSGGSIGIATTQVVAGASASPAPRTFNAIPFIRGGL